MKDKMFAVRIDAKLENRYNELARKTGRTKTHYVREALANYITDLEDHYAAQTILHGIDKGTVTVRLLDEWEDEINGGIKDLDVENNKRRRKADQ